MSKKVASDVGKTLLHFFREEQKARGNEGCECNDCQEDMEKAWQHFHRWLTS